ncbi:hypothetical protein BTT_61650 (plasmid) [Bacillus thuringiensis serovar morrisoni str. 4AA1]|uniref:YdcF family protein n=1 Tax=Bacillus TaxID=1386 RepID=UPI0005CE1594|nr:MULTISPECIES: YdcF family protein [Bacillus]AJQ62806.1 hypothetical protein SD98_31690 [Bacillus thuringiensis serovar morrisoni]MED3102567.1 YdcF family protein [Bacillus thuringiensis]MRA99488.1 YdcF family protein [Bacillus thuringiensis]OTY42687.1 hypothetical protein BK736_09135 [Bacillus thuringiensis serovar poloniensis]RNG31904.1 YdcF family protein [Bacillus thuringiensis]
MYISQLNSKSLTVSQMTNLLFTGIEDDNKNGECIFVVGSREAVRYRLPTAVELYNKRRAGKILFSGGAKWKRSNFTEAMTLKKEAIILGVPERDILIEDISLNTLENVLASLLVLEREFHLYNINRLLAVTTSYHMKRLYLTLKTYMPSWIKLTLCPANDTVVKKNTWFLSEEGRKFVQTESEKIIRYVKQGSLIDEQIKYKI